jgi:hypothetical protein
MTCLLGKSNIQVVGVFTEKRTRSCSTVGFVEVIEPQLARKE